MPAGQETYQAAYSTARNTYTQQCYNHVSRDHTALQKYDNNDDYYNT